MEWQLYRGEGVLVIVIVIVKKGGLVRGNVKKVVLESSFCST